MRAKPLNCAWWLMPGVLGALAACSPSPLRTGQTASPPPPLPIPSVEPSPRRFQESFDAWPQGSLPSDFVNVMEESVTPSWVYPGRWFVSVDNQQNKVLLHEEERKPPGVSFLRYRGTHMGTPDGRLPNAYYAEVTQRPLSSPYNYPPIGDQGTPFYYRKHDTYLEVVLKPDWIEIWEADGAEPRSTKGWKRLWHQSLKTQPGDVRRVGARVDVQAGTFSATLDGRHLATVESPLLQSKEPAYFALRAIGNVVSFDDVLIEASDHAGFQERL